MLPIPGTSSVAHLEDNLAAAQVELAQQELDTLAQVSALPREYPGWMVAMQNQDPRGVLAK